MTRLGPIFRSSASAAPAVSDPVLGALELKAKGRIDDALGVLVRSGQLTVDSCNLRGDIEKELGRMQDAARSYSAALALDAANSHAQYQRGWCFHTLEEWEKAADCFRALLAQASHRDDARLALGGCLLNLGRREEALACFEQCWSSASRSHAEFGKGVALQMARRFDEAEAAYARALVLDPQLTEALSNLIAMSLEVFDLERIHRYARRLLEMTADSKIALQGLLIVSLERQDYDQAAHYFSRISQHSHDTSGKDLHTPASATYRLSAEVVTRLKQIMGVSPQLSGTTPLRAPGRKP